MGCSQHFFSFVLSPRFPSKIHSVFLSPGQSHPPLVPFLSVVIIFLIFTSSFWVFCHPFLFQVYFRCSSFLDPSPLSSILHLVETKGASLRVRSCSHLLQTSPINLEQPTLQGQHDVEARTWLHQRPLASSELSSSFPLPGTEGTCSVVIMMSSYHPHNFQPLPGCSLDASPLSCLLSRLHFTF